MLGPLCAGLYRSIYFGLFDRLNQKNTKNNEYLHFLIFPLVASFSASVATMVPDKLRNFSFQINEDRSKSIERRYRKEEVELKETAQLLV